MLQESCSWRHADRSQWIRMAPGEVSGLKNGEPVMAGVLGGDYKDRMADYQKYCRVMYRFDKWHWHCHCVTEHSGLERPRLHVVTRLEWPWLCFAPCVDHRQWGHRQSSSPSRHSVHATSQWRRTVHRRTTVATLPAACHGARWQRFCTALQCRNICLTASTGTILLCIIASVINVLSRGLTTKPAKRRFCQRIHNRCCLSKVLLLRACYVYVSQIRNLTDQHIPLTRDVRILCVQNFAQNWPMCAKLTKQHRNCTLHFALFIQPYCS